MGTRLSSLGTSKFPSESPPPPNHRQVHGGCITHTHPGFGVQKQKDNRPAKKDTRLLPELELELIQSHMAQKPVLRGKVGCACAARLLTRTRTNKNLAQKSVLAIEVGARALRNQTAGWLGGGVLRERVQQSVESLAQVCVSGPQTGNDRKKE